MITEPKTFYDFEALPETAKEKMRKIYGEKLEGKTFEVVFDETAFTWSLKLYED